MSEPDPAWRETGAAELSEIDALRAELAAIAIENARLLDKTQAARARQTASAGILRVISETPGDLQPVFDLIARSAAELCGARFCMLWRYAGGLVHHCANAGFETGSLDAYLAGWPKPAPPGSMTGAVFDSGAVCQIADCHDPGYSDHRLARDVGYRHLIGVPIFSGGAVWGVIVLGWPDGARPTEAHVDLVRSFADQAAIAIGAATLFREVQARTAEVEVEEALVRQTASADILRVISQSPDETKPVFDAIVTTAVRLLSSDIALVMISDADSYAPFAGATPDGLTGLNPQVVPIYPALNFPSRALMSRARLHLPDWTAIHLPDHERKWLGLFEQVPGVPQWHLEKSRVLAKAR